MYDDVDVCLVMAMRYWIGRKWTKVVHHLHCSTCVDCIDLMVICCDGY